jgi:hypothetical protein
MMILSAARSISCDVPSRYPSMVDQTNSQRHTKPQHSPWLEPEYRGDRYNENTDGGSVSEEKMNHTQCNTHNAFVHTYSLKYIFLDNFLLVRHTTVGGVVN